MASDLGGVWRTIGGRRIFIKDGQDLATAMKESGKFGNKKEMTKEEKADKSILLKNQREELRQKINKGGLKKEEYDKIKEEIKKITEQKKELDKDLSEEDLKEARHRLEKKEYIDKQPKINLENEEKQFNNLMDKELGNIKEELSLELKNIEKYENDYGIDSQIIEEINTESMQRIKNMYDDGKISDYVYEKYADKVNEEMSNIMSEKGYDLYDHNGEIYYSMLPKAKDAYDNILNELNKKNVKYKISKSWNPGELPSIYVEDDDGNQFRIANHFNSKNQQFDAYSLEQNKIYSTKDYINYKETVIKDLNNFLGKNAYDKYIDEHPNSKLTFNDFIEKYYK